MTAGSRSARCIGAGCTWLKAARTSAARMPSRHRRRSHSPCGSICIPVNVSRQQDGEAVLLRLHGGGWRLRADGARISLEESIYLGGLEPRRERAGGADGVCGWAAAGEMGHQQGGVQRSRGRGRVRVAVDTPLTLPCKRVDRA